MRKVDKVFLFLSLTLVGAGFFIFLSAGTGLLAREGARFSSIAFNQILLGLIPGLFLIYLIPKINIRIFRKYSLFIFIAGLVLTCLVFIPGIGFSHGGAKRWIILGGISFQPSEFLKIAYILFLSAYLSKAKDKVESLKGGVIPFFIITSVVGFILLKQPDTDTFAVIFTAGICMFFVAGAKWKHIISLILISALAFVTVALFKPYIMQRVSTFLNPNSDSLGASYQIQQSLIAIGSGGMFGRGFGQSVQKFNFLPEPIGDSVFAVFAEEFGFIGGVILIALFVLFALRGLRISTKTNDMFGKLVALGIIVMIVTQSFVNIGAMLGVIPLSGITLTFVSQGGTALLFSLISIGFVLNVSKFSRS